MQIVRKRECRAKQILNKTEFKLKGYRMGIDQDGNIGGS